MNFSCFLYSGESSVQSKHFFTGEMLQYYFVTEHIHTLTPPRSSTTKRVKQANTSYATLVKKNCEQREHLTNFSSCPDSTTLLYNTQYHIPPPPSFIWALQYYMFLGFPSKMGQNSLLAKPTIKKGQLQHEVLFCFEKARVENQLVEFSGVPRLKYPKAMNLKATF